MQSKIGCCKPVCSLLYFFEEKSDSVDTVYNCKLPKKITLKKSVRPKITSTMIMIINTKTDESNKLSKTEDNTRARARARAHTHTHTQSKQQKTSYNYNYANKNK
jgi:hypothetical protein